jgi:hypothetical protein|eukprot:COSAG06_NODE_8793_length_2070_cov_1.559107_2_plen_51_part_00
MYLPASFPQQVWHRLLQVALWLLRWIINVDQRLHERWLTGLLAMLWCGAR